MKVSKEKASSASGANSQPPRFLRGQVVEIRSLPEILATLDANATLDGLPFMPEMARLCGRRFRVSRRADKTCVEGRGMRLMGATVFLEDLRCDGSAHDGCQRNCLIFWKEAWLKSVNEQSATDPLVGSLPSDDYARSRDLPTRKGDLYFCQSTELAGATRPLSRWNILHFATDILYGELSLGRFFRIVARMATNRIRYLGGLPALGNLVGQRRGRPGVPGARKGDLDLRPGEWVEVKLADEVKATLDANGKNCGLSFEPEMLEYCGRRFEVDFPVRKIILEETGQMIGLTRTVALKGVTCQGLCTKNCPRSNPFYWREIWLRRTE